MCVWLCGVVVVVGTAPQNTLPLWMGMVVWCGYRYCGYVMWCYVGGWVAGCGLTLICISVGERIF